MLIEKRKDTTFKPVTVSITFQTQEELDTMFKIMGYNVAIPTFISDELKSITTKEVKIFTDFMSYFHRMLK